MTKRDFFILLVKTFGLYTIVVTLFSVLPGNISFALMHADLTAYLWIGVTIIVFFGLLILLIFFAKHIVNLLKLDKGFDDDRIELGNLKKEDIIKLGCFIIGGIIFLKNIPAFLSHTLFAFKEDLAGMNYGGNNKFLWLVSGINLIIGYLLLTKYYWVARIFTSKKRIENQ